MTDEEGERRRCFPLAASACALLCLCSRLLSLYHDVTRSFSPLPSTRPRPRISPPHLSLVLFVSTTAPPPLTSSLSSLAPLPPLFLLRANPSAHNQTGPFFGTQVSNLSTPTANQCLPLPPAYYSTCVCAPPNRLFYWKRSRPTPRRPLFSPPFSVPQTKRIDRAHLAHVKHESAPSIFRFGSHTHWCSDGNLNGCQFITTQSYPAPGPVISFPVGLDPAGPRLLLFHVHSYCSRTRCLAIEFANCLRA
ncbi:hypothetical protein BJV77DRAFT_303207 [Russula vinacea]|nr:hypothetical protein BJV77DRAFT_303207 [Russula vinacea]